MCVRSAWNTQWVPDQYVIQSNYVPQNKTSNKQSKRDLLVSASSKWFRATMRQCQDLISLYLPPTIALSSSEVRFGKFSIYYTRHFPPPNLYTVKF